MNDGYDYVNMNQKIEKIIPYKSKHYHKKKPPVHHGVKYKIMTSQKRGSPVMEVKSQTE